MYITLIFKIETITYPSLSHAGAHHRVQREPMGRAITGTHGEPNEVVQHGKGGAME